MDTEQRLLERINDGDRKAQRELYDRFAGTAMAVAMRYVADRDAARDVLQEAFIKVFTHVGGFRPRGEGTLRSWVMRVVANEAVDWLKRQRFVAQTVELPDEVPEEEPDVGSVPLEALQQMIQQLPDGYRLVFTLYVMEQKSHQEIASLLGIQENSSASQFLRAKRMLAKAIKNYKQQQR